MEVCESCLGNFYFPKSLCRRFETDGRHQLFQVYGKSGPTKHYSLVWAIYYQSPKCNSRFTEATSNRKKNITRRWKPIRTWIVKDSRDMGLFSCEINTFIGAFGKQNMFFARRGFLHGTCNVSGLVIEFSPFNEKLVLFVFHCAGIYQGWIINTRFASDTA